ncbi:MAG: hypothetical protein EBZ13_13355, partial [Planctomycetia bacterium]|nr:hypothetical protein [Planctomycetia bacterium]
MKCFLGSTGPWFEPLCAAAMLVAGLLGSRATAVADLPDPPRIAGFERFSRPLLTGTPVAD